MLQFYISWQPVTKGECPVTDLVIHCWSQLLVNITLKVGFHYPSSQAELTARELGCIF